MMELADLTRRAGVTRQVADAITVYLVEYGVAEVAAAEFAREVLNGQLEEYIERSSR